MSKTRWFIGGIVLEYIWWWLTDRGKYTYWGKIEEPRVWEQNPIVIKDKELSKLWKNVKKKIEEPDEVEQW